MLKTQSFGATVTREDRRVLPLLRSVTSVGVKYGPRGLHLPWTQCRHQAFLPLRRIRVPTMTWSSPTSSSGLLSKASFSKLRLPTLILSTSAPVFKALLEHVTRQDENIRRVQLSSYRATPFHSPHPMLSTFMSTAMPPVLASRCLSRLGPHCQCRRAHQQEEEFGANGVTRWTLRCAENLPMWVRLISYQVHAYFVENVPLYLLPELLNYSRTVCLARRQR
jgi:hypothetical protein